MPEELLLTVGPVCRTLSLATLQSYMPPTSHWRGLGLGHGAEKPSDYVNIFIGQFPSVLQTFPFLIYWICLTVSQKKLLLRTCSGTCDYGSSWPSPRTCARRDGKAGCERSLWRLAPVHPPQEGQVQVWKVRVTSSSPFCINSSVLVSWTRVW